MHSSLLGFLCALFSALCTNYTCLLRKGFEEDTDYEASSSDENDTFSVDPPVSQPPTNILPSKNGKLVWSVSPLLEQQCRLSAANVIKMVPGPTRIE